MRGKFIFPRIFCNNALKVYTALCVLGMRGHMMTQIKDFLTAVQQADLLGSDHFEKLENFYTDYQKSQDLDQGQGGGGSTALTNFIWLFGIVVVFIGLVILLAALAEEYDLSPLTVGGIGGCFFIALWSGADRLIVSPSLHFMRHMLITLSVLGLAVSMTLPFTETEYQQEEVMGYVFFASLLCLSLFALQRYKFLFLTTFATAGLWGLIYLTFETDQMTQVDYSWLGFWTAWATLMAGWVLAVRYHLHFLFWTRKMALILLAVSMGGNILGLEDPNLGWHILLISSGVLALFSFYCRQTDGYAASFVGLFSFTLHLIADAEAMPLMIKALITIICALIIMYLGLWLHRHTGRLENLMPYWLKKYRPDPYEEPISYVI